MDVEGLAVKFPSILPSWQYGDPVGFVDAFIGKAVRQEARGEAISCRAAEPKIRDRYYTQSRRLHIRNLMRGNR